MAVYKKDGSVYKLNGPNNLMVTQEKWGSFIGHNLQNLSNFKMESNIPHVVIGSKKEEKIVPEEKTIIEETKVIEEKIIVAVTEKEKIENTKPIVQNRKNEFEGFPKTVMHCALVEYTEKKDLLYEDVSLKKKYVDSFTFECIIISTNDFVMTIWTSTDKLKVGSVLFPQNDSKRWWEIKEIESVPGGYKIVCITTKNTLAF